MKGGRAMEKWNTLKSDYLYRTPFGNLRKEACKLPNGFIIEEFYINEYPDWVNAVVLTKEKEMVLVEQYRHGGGDFYLEIPAGKLEADENDEEGVLREVLEETGYTSHTRPMLLGDYMVNPAVQTNKIRTYLLLDAFQVQTQQLDATEEIDVVLADFDNFEEQIRSGTIKTQLFTASAYYMARAFLAQSTNR